MWKGFHADGAGRTARPPASPPYAYLDGHVPRDVRCERCLDMGFVKGGPADKLGTCPDCDLGRAELRELEACLLQVCCVCGRPGAAQGCATCAAMYDYYDDGLR